MTLAPEVSMSTRSHRSMTLLAAAALAGLLAASPAGAADELEDKAAAQALFEEGKRLMTEGRYAEACARLEESQALDKGMGTQFHLASCYEATGRTASAWALFLEVAAAARAAGMQEREDLARRRAADLEPRLARLTIVAPDDPATGLVIERDGVPVGRGQWGTSVPVDPGEHTITAAAPGRKPWRTLVRVPDESTVIAVPELAAAPRPAAPREPPRPAPPPVRAAVHGLRPVQVAGLVGGGLGIAGLGAGAVLGLLAQSKLDASAEHCAGDLCKPAGAELRARALDLGNGATAAFIAGGALVAGGVTLILVGRPADSAAPPDRRGSLHVAPTVGAGQLGLSFGGRL